MGFGHGHIWHVDLRRNYHVTLSIAFITEVSTKGWMTNSTSSIENFGVSKWEPTIIGLNDKVDLYFDVLHNREDFCVPIMDRGVKM